MKFRPDIEGLRALAIVPVVAFHAWPALLPGGFVGVDIFFVISGYLITSLLLQQLADGRYSIAAFYAARIRRIFPALFAMLALLAPVCWWLLEPAALHEFARQLGATTLFLSNIELYRTAGYFESAAELKMLLHTWSLAVEEQYYIVFPPLLALLWRIAPQRIGTLLTIIGLVSLACCLHWMSGDPDYAFYAMPARTFELMAGALLACRAARAGARSERPAWVDGWVGGGALLALLAAMVWMPAHRLFPAPAALWPCLATAALIWVGESGRAAVTGWLAAAPLRWVGRLSFSLYLWHWPLLVLTRHLALDAPTALQAGLAVVLSVLLAWASLRWIETPVRRAAVSQRLLLWGGLGTLLFALAGAWGLTAVADQRAAQPGRAAQLRAGANDVSPDRRSCHLAGRLWLDYDARCRLGAAQAPRTLAVWGDSHGVELARALADHWAGQPDGRRVLQLTGSTCPPVLDFEAPMLPRCAQGNREVLARLAADPAVDTVLLAARYELYLKGPAARAFADGLASTVRSLHAAGKRVLLLDPVPTYDYPVPAALAQRWQRGEALALQGQTRAEYLARQAPALGLLARLASGGQARRVVVGERLCADARCRVVQEDQALYFDDNHLSMHGAAVIVPAVLRELPELDGAREGRVK